MKSSLTVFIVLLVCLILIPNLKADKKTKQNKPKHTTTPVDEENIVLSKIPEEGKDGVYFVETFNSESTFWERWKNLASNKYKGKFKVKDVQDKSIGGTGVKKGDKGLLVSSENEFHGVMTLFDKPLIKKDQDLVIQYEVKATQKIDCSGAYIKLLTNTKKSPTFQNVDHNSPHSVMFGPDKCGQSPDSVQFIYQYRNQSENDETYIKFSLESQYGNKDARKLKFKNDNLTHLYTLVIKATNFEIYIDQELVKSGSLYDRDIFDPPLLQPEFISDLNEKKPKKWVEEEYIISLTAESPDDWDETQTEFISDPNAKPPSNWKETPYFIPDLSKKKPRDWSDEEDGPWSPPLKPNPLCSDGKTACGEWKAPEIKNPDYRGKWKRPQIKNPEYKGPWSPSLIKNPDYKFDPTPHHFAPMVGILIEIWALQKGMLFDNIIVTTNINEAKRFADKTWKVKHQQELERFYPTPTLKERYEQLIESAKKNPILVITGVSSVLLCLFFFWLIRFINQEPSKRENDFGDEIEEELELELENEEEIVEQEDENKQTESIEQSQKSKTSKKKDETQKDEKNRKKEKEKVVVFEESKNVETEKNLSKNKKKKQQQGTDNNKESKVEESLSYTTPLPSSTTASTANTKKSKQDKKKK